MRMDALSAIQRISSAPSGPLFHSFGDGVLVFRGTSNLREVALDLSVTSSPFLECRVHSGFKRVYDSVRKDVMKEKPSVLAGYSLGGALSVLAAMEMVEEGMSPPSVFCFGAPRVGDSCFREKYDSVLGDKTAWIVNECDVVPTQPFYFSGVGKRKAFSIDAGPVGSHLLPCYEEGTLTLESDPLLSLLRSGRGYIDKVVTRTIQRNIGAKRRGTFHEHEQK